MLSVIGIHYVLARFVLTVSVICSYPIFVLFYVW